MSMRDSKQYTWPAPHGADGFTLIELIIVVAIIGILGAIAYPSFSEQMKRGKRSDVQTVMLQAAQYMQRNYAANNKFVMDDDTWKKSGYASAPMGEKDDSNITYDITVAVNCTGRCFTLTAAPRVTDAKCGQLTLEDTGAKGSEKGSVADCWK